MKKERKLKLKMNKVSVSNLNTILGAGDPNLVPSVNAPCVLTTILKTVPGVDCRTGDTKTDMSLLDCINNTLNKC